MDKLQELVSRLEIGDVLCRYSRGVDRRDWALVKECFHDDAVDQHGEFIGDPNAFIEWVSNRHANIRFSMHFLGNCLIEFQSSDHAIVETYFIALQRRENTDVAQGGTDYEVFARYCDRFERREGVWRIAERRVVYDFDQHEAQYIPVARVSWGIRPTRSQRHDLSTQGRRSLQPTKCVTPGEGSSAKLPRATE